VKVNIIDAGERSFLIQFSTEPNPSLLAYLCHLQEAIRTTFGLWLIDSIVSYNTLYIEYDIFKVEYYAAKSALNAFISQFSPMNTSSVAGKTIQLPVYYDSDLALDMGSVCEALHLSTDEVIQLHCQNTYHVYGVGFAPGFAFLGQLDAQLHLPRRMTPRLNVPKGAVAIANSQTGVYPSNSPGGWNLIGLCPLDLAVNYSHEQSKLMVGDKVEFYAIDQSDYVSMKGAPWG
jgi:KipI family sensor histidine kinase inhibitor